MKVGLATIVPLLLGAALARGSEGIEEPTPEPVGATLTEQGDLRIYEAVVAGEIHDWALVPRSAPPDSIALLVDSETEDHNGLEARQVWIWNLAGDLESVGPELSSKAAGVAAFDPKGDGSAEVLVLCEGQVLGLDEDGSWVSVLDSPSEMFRVDLADGSRIRSSRGVLLLRSVDLLQALEIDPLDGSLRTAWQLELPVQVDRRWAGLRFHSPPVSYWPGEGGGPARLVVGPEAHGARRLQTILGIWKANARPEILEAWSRFSSLEQLEESWYVVYEGAPALLVTTVLADKHGVFEKKKLRLFALSADRTRSGTTPLLEAVTKSRNWYGTCAGIADLNGDGLDDVISAQPKGLGGGKLWVEAHLARGGGGFETKVRGSEIRVEEGENCTLAVDVSGDGHNDLVVVEGNSLLVFPLLRSAQEKRVVADAPLWRARVHDIDGSAVPARLFHTSVSQVVFLGHTEGGRLAIRAVRFPEALH